MSKVHYFAEQLVQILLEKGLQITTVESCTGGGLANAITNVQGASGVLTGAKVCYSTQEIINFGVPASIISRYTVYSKEAAIEMAEAGIRNVFGANIGIGITGNISSNNPPLANITPGTIYIAVKYGNTTFAEVHNYATYLTRPQMKEAIIIDAIILIIHILT